MLALKRLASDTDRDEVRLVLEAEFADLVDLRHQAPASSSGSSEMLSSSALSCSGA